MEVEKYINMKIPHHSFLNETVAGEQGSWLMGDYLQRQLVRPVNMKSVVELLTDFIVQIK